MTAVEFLVQEINKLTGLTIAMDEPCVEQAKEIEREQREKDLESGFHTGRLYQGREGDTTLEQLKSKTFGKE